MLILVLRSFAAVSSRTGWPRTKKFTLGFFGPKPLLKFWLDDLFAETAKSYKECNPHVIVRGTQTQKVKGGNEK